MKIACIWEHNGEDTLLYVRDYPGAFARGENLKTALAKLPTEIRNYQKWCGLAVSLNHEIEIVQDVPSELNIRDADSDALLDGENAPISFEEYQTLKRLTLKSAEDFLRLYESIPDKDAPLTVPRKTFYGQIPSTSEEMYQHTKSVNAYYFGEIGIDADNEGTILGCRLRGFEQLEENLELLSAAAVEGSYGEYWSVRKVLRRFLWHDRIHAKALYRHAIEVFDARAIANPFSFEL